MSAFSKKVYRAFAPLIQKHGFKPARAVADRAFAAVVARPAEDICYYVFARDARSGGGDLSSHLWVAPPDVPNDGLERLGMGFKIHLGNIYEPEEGFFEAVAKRAETLLPHLYGIAEAVRLEYQTPAFNTLRLRTYRMQRALFDAVRHHPARPARHAWETLYAMALRVAADKTEYDDLESECNSAVKTLLQEPSFQTASGYEEFVEHSDVAGIALAYQLYIETLVPFHPTRSG
jgi:hypothetical protein